LVPWLPSPSALCLQRLDLAREAIRLTCNTKAPLPDNLEVAGLLALMLLTDACRAARSLGLAGTRFSNS
jgi:predicted RNA polymerase sigma factor